MNDVELSQMVNNTLSSEPEFVQRSSRLGLGMSCVGLGTVIALGMLLHAVPVIAQLTVAQAEDSEEDEDEMMDDEEDEDLSTANALQQLMDALDAEPDLGPVPIQPMQANLEPISPYRIYVDMEVRGTSNAGFVSDSLEEDILFLPTVTFVAAPSITENAQLVATLGGGTGLYGDSDTSEFGYLSGSIGVNWDFAPLTFTRVELIGQQFWSFENDDFQSASLQFQMGQYRLFFDNEVFVRYYYQTDATLTNEPDVDSYGNSLNASVLYPLSGRLQGQLSYRMALDAYMNEPRTDFNNRLRGEMRFAINDRLSFRTFVSYTNNASTEGDRSYDEFAYGLGLTTDLPLGGGR